MVTRYGISIIGGGRLGRSLGCGLRERGWKVHSVVTRSRATAKRAVRAIGGGSPRYSISGQELASDEERTPSYWEGAVVYSGTLAGAGYLEMTGYAKPMRL